MNPYPLVWIVMGVAGSGKSTVGRQLAARFDCDFLEGDRRHPPSNIRRMQQHLPLQEGERDRWLTALVEDITREIERKQEMVLACSGLKVAHRQRLTAPGRVQLLLLVVPPAILQDRLRGRQHFFGPDLLSSQLQAFEDPQPEEPLWHINGVGDPEAIAQRILEQSRRRWPILQQPWWQRQEHN